MPKQPKQNLANPISITYGVKAADGKIDKVEIPYAGCARSRSLYPATQKTITSRTKAASEELAKGSSRFGLINNSTLVTNGLTEEDVDWFRPESAIPTEPSAIMAACRQAYDRFSIVRCIIDLMSDLTAKGIKIVNKNEGAEKFGREWFIKVNGADRTERIANMLYMMGTVPIKRGVGQLPQIKATAKNTKPIRIKRKNPLKAGQIPLSYTILNPVDLSLPDNTEPSSSPQINLYSTMASSAAATKRGNQLMGGSWLTKEEKVTGTPLDPSKHILLFYKRNDHEAAPRPIMYPVLRDLRTLGKLKMSDDAALEGAVSRTRLWTLGYYNEEKPEQSYIPTSDELADLADIITQSVGGGTVDLVWNQFLDFKETSTDLHHFLGKEKYVPTIDAIYQGFGVPPTMAGGTGSTGHTNNFVSISILAERLEYGRNILKSFWEGELEIIQSQMGYRNPFLVTFDDPTFSDEAAEKRLLIELMDRGVISEEVVKDRFGTVPDIETARVKREMGKRKRGIAPPKAGPFSEDWRKDVMNERSFVTQGQLTPDQVGLEYPDPKPGALTPTEVNTKETIKVQKVSARISKKKDLKSVEPLKRKKPKGRPPGSDDVVKRKRKRVVPLGRGSLNEDEVSLADYLVAVAKTEKAQLFINEYVKGVYLEMVGKKNIRQLSSKESELLENTCFAVLCSVEPSNVSEASINNALSANAEIPDEILSEYQGAIASMPKDASLDSARKIKAAIVASYKMV